MPCKSSMLARGMTRRRHDNDKTQEKIRGRDRRRRKRRKEKEREENKQTHSSATLAIGLAITAGKLWRPSPYGSPLRNLSWHGSSRYADSRNE